MANIVAYCRVSTDKSDQLNSLATQKEFFEAFAVQHKHNLIRIYADEGISGTKTKNRKEFQRMMADARQGSFEIVVVKDISRLARNTVDLLQSTRELKQLGIETHFLTANMSVMGNSEFVLTIFGALAQEESANTSKRIKFGKKLNAEKGRVPNLVYGYDKTPGDYFNLAVNEQEATVVCRIFDLYVNQGYGFSLIAKMLNQEGLRTKRDCRWSMNAIGRILSNELYAGQVINGKCEIADFLTGKRTSREQSEWYITERPDLAIVGQNLFDQAQQLYQKRVQDFNITGERNSNKHVFSTLIKCKECGHTFRRSVRKYKNTYVSWVCNGRNVNGTEFCANKSSVPEEELLESLTEYFASILLNRKNLMEDLVRDFEQEYKKRSSEHKTGEQIEASLRKLRKSKQRYMDLYADDLITREESKEKIAPINTEIDRLESELQLVQQHITGGEQFAEILGQAFQGIEDIAKAENLTNAQLKRMIKKIEVDKDGHIDIYLNFFSGLGLSDAIPISDYGT